MVEEDIPRDHGYYDELHGSASIYIKCEVVLPARMEQSVVEQEKIYVEYVKIFKILKFPILHDIFLRLLSLNSETNLYQSCCVIFVSVIPFSP